MGIPHLRPKHKHQSNDDRIRTENKHRYMRRGTHYIAGLSVGVLIILFFIFLLTVYNVMQHNPKSSDNILTVHECTLYVSHFEKRVHSNKRR